MKNKRTLDEILCDMKELNNELSYSLGQLHKSLIDCGIATAEEINKKKLAMNKRIRKKTKKIDSINK